jgi:uncharacterized protein YjbI with pentapeptide repeats
MGNPEIKNRFTGDIIIPAGKYASIREACEKSRANLSWANLSEANLSEANLSRADLSGANLSRADLYGANLSKADLSGANLSKADLSRADLSWANLSGANLSGAKIWGEVITKHPIQISGLKWWITITEKHIQIGCQVHKAEEWFGFKDADIAKMHEEALPWWNKNKKLIKSAWELHTK